MKWSCDHNWQLISSWTSGRKRFLVYRCRKCGIERVEKENA